MRILLIIISVVILCAGCGKKDRPEYKSQTQYNKSIYII